MRLLPIGGQGSRARREVWNQSWHRTTSAPPYRHVAVDKIVW